MQVAGANRKSKKDTDTVLKASFLTVSVSFLLHGWTVTIL